MVACVSQRLSDEFVNLSVSERIARMNRSESQPLSNQHPSMTQPHYGTISKKSKAPVIPTSASMATSQKVYYSQVPLESDCKSPTVKLSRSQSAVSCRRQKLVRRPSVAPPLPPSHSGRITAQCWYHGNLDRQNATEKLINFAKVESNELHCQLLINIGF